MTPDALRRSTQVGGFRVLHGTVAVTEKQDYGVAVRREVRPTRPAGKKYRLRASEVAEDGSNPARREDVSSQRLRKPFRAVHARLVLALKVLQALVAEV